MGRYVHALVMDADAQLKHTLHITVANAVSRMAKLKDPFDRRCLFQEYKEWLGRDVSDEVWAMPSDWNYKPMDI